LLNALSIDSISKQGRTVVPVTRREFDEVKIDGADKSPAGPRSNHEISGSITLVAMSIK
jgi:hypothetical protein